MNRLSIKENKKSIVVSVQMGLGHLRAAYALRHLAEDGEVLIYGEKRTTPRREYRIWKKMRKLYYFSSRAGKIPLIGKYILNIMLYLQKIKPLYPFRDHSRPNLATLYLNWLISKKNLCSGLIRKAKEKQLPLVHTFYATAIACDQKLPVSIPNYLLICDADFNRVWVPLNPKESHLIYFAPCTQVKKRLLSYGVCPEQIKITGFPLPVENIGTAEKMEILKADLFQRLLRLDPENKFFNFHRYSVLKILEREEIPEQRENYFYLNLSIGGAGAQVEILKKIVCSLREKVLNDEIRLILSCGTNADVFHSVYDYLHQLNLLTLPKPRIRIVHHANPLRYFQIFNQNLRTTDVLWTKPSELSFYCALGIPILTSPPIGTHEEINKRWLFELHAAIDPPAPEIYINEWLFDLRNNGRLAEAAWDGFLKAPKLGTFNISQIVCEENKICSEPVASAEIKN